MRSDDTRNSAGRAPMFAASVAVFLFLPTTAGALSCAPDISTLAEAYEVADSIIVGIVTSCVEPRSKDAWARGGSNCSYDTLEVLKEASPARDYRGIASSSACGLSLLTGSQYLLFLDAENKPLRYSAPLTGESVQTRRASDSLNILRDYRDGLVGDLSEPWRFTESEFACSLTHVVGGQRLGFSVHKADGLKSPTRDWTRETVDGMTTISGRAEISDASSPTGAGFDVVATGNFPNYPDGTQMLSVSLMEPPPVSVRQATIKVDSRSWPLYRMETSVSFRGQSRPSQVSYVVGGEIAEQILSAISEVSDIVVSATLVTPPDSDNELADDSQTAPLAAVRSPQDDNYFGPAPPRAAIAMANTARQPTAPYGSESSRKPPTPVLQLTTRSTQLRTAVAAYRACRDGSGQQTGK